MIGAGGEPKASHERVAAVAPVTLARTSERYLPESSSSHMYAI
jgi:hypothetical protein